MQKIAIIGPTGMLGSMVYNVLKDKYELVLVGRNQKKLSLLDQRYGDVVNHRFVRFEGQEIYQDYLHAFPAQTISPHLKILYESIGEVEMVINCSGIIKPGTLANPALTLFFNGAFPQILSANYQDKLIHITTDCVFSGVSDAPYTEDSPRSPIDLYGLSKSLGEPKELSLVFRTSIVGPELSGTASLLEWLRSQNNNTVKGFKTHYWNGITTKEFGRVCDLIISNRSAYPKNGLFHIFSNDMTKYEMLEIMKKKYVLNVTIEAVEPAGIDRRLRTIYDLNERLAFPSFSEMIEGL